MLLVKMTDPDSNVMRISQSKGGVVVDAQFWYPYLGTVSPIQLRLDKVYGGMYRNSGTGTVEVSARAVVWPAPLKQTFEFTYSDNFGRTTALFTCTGYLKAVQGAVIKYQLYNKEYEIDSLDGAPDFDTETDRVYPLVFGTVSLVNSLRVGTVLDYTYYKAGIVGTNPTITSGNYSVYDIGIQKDKYTVPGSGTVVDQTTTFKSVLSSDGTTANAPYGDIRMSGIGSVTDLDEFFSWAVSRINNDPGFSGYTLNTDYSRSVSPSVNFYQTSQINILDLMSNVSAFFSHCFYIDESTKVIHLVDMFLDNGETSLSSGDGEVSYYFTSDYSYPVPLKELKAEWTYNTTGEDSDRYPLFIEQEHSMNVTAPNTFGATDSINPYTTIVTEVNTALENIGILIQAPITRVSVPYSTNLVPGRKLYFTDTGAWQTSHVQIRARTLQFNPENEEIKVEGNIF